VTGRGRILAPFEERNFALLWAGMTVSLVGDGVLLVALAWQVYELVNAPAAIVAVALVPLAVVYWLGSLLFRHP